MDADMDINCRIDRECNVDMDMDMDMKMDWIWIWICNGYGYAMGLDFLCRKGVSCCAWYSIKGSGIPAVLKYIEVHLQKS